MVNKRIPVTLLCLLLCLAIASISNQSGAAPATVANDKLRTPLKVGFIMVGPINDQGWNYAHNQGRLYLESALPNQIITTFAEKVPENSEAERVMEKMIAQGNKLIFATSFGYLEPVMRVAARHPDIIFMQCNRLIGAQNIGSYPAYIYEPMYICGVVAGRVTKTNKLAFVAGFPIAQVMQEINAFELGARSVNPKAKVHVVWTNSWNDAPADVEASRGLIETGADVLVCIDTFLALRTAEQKGAFSVGDSVDLHQLLPKSWLTGACWNWGPVYLKVTRSVLNHTWKTGTEPYGMQAGAVTLASFGTAVPKDVQQEALAIAQQITQGKLTVFQGPLKDRDGRVRLAVGEKPSLNWLANMDWFVAGVQGTLPRK